MELNQKEVLVTTREKWLEEHPKHKEIQSYGYGDRSTQRATMLVYLDLCEMKHWFNVHIHPCESLKTVYITGRIMKKSRVTETVVPISSLQELTPQEMQEFASELGTNGGEPTVTLAICDADSSIVYYKISNDLIPPDEPEEEEKIKPKKIRKRYKKQRKDQ